MEFNSRISVFGGRVIQDSLYEKIIKIGEMLAKENYLTFCGGGKGVMEAIAKGVTNKKVHPKFKMGKILFKKLNPK